MRAYFFGNMYLSSIQQGIQALHVVSEMFVKYGSATLASEALWNWAENHKTVVLLNAGYSDTIRDVIGLFDTFSNPYPWAQFYEGEDALDGALTSVGIILPEKIYAVASLVREGTIDFADLEVGRVVHPETLEAWDFSKWEAKLVEELNKYGLAH